MTFDNVNNPSHYTQGRSFEPLDVINDWELGFCLGNALKYIARAGRKGCTVEDLKKAIFYLNREISYIESTQAPTFSGDIPRSVLGGSDEDIPFDSTDYTWTVSSYAGDMAKLGDLYRELEKADPLDLAPSEFEPDVDEDPLGYWNESPTRADFLFEFDR